MLQSLTQFLANPLLWKIVAAYWVFNSLVTALPEPGQGKLYQFVYRFLHTLAGNLDRAAKKFDVPGAQP